MGRLHPLADELLLKLCQHYISTGNTEFSPADITTDLKYDPYFADLEANDYIIKKDDINETVILLERTINFANQMH